MKKYLILTMPLLIMSICHGMYMSEAEMMDCEKLDSNTYRKMDSCAKNHSDCVKLEKGFKCKTFSKQAVDVEDRESPKFTKSEMEVCDGETDCEDKLSAKSCTDSAERALINESFTEVYCSKQDGYNTKSVMMYREDAGKKYNYDYAENVKRLNREARKRNAVTAAGKLRNGDSLTQLERDNLLKYLSRNVK